MELRILNYFLTVAKEENITKAAKLLYITQPTLSRQLAQLEEELGVELFHRSNHKIVLTEEGKLLQRRAEEILFLADKTKEELSYDKDTIVGKISIGCGEFLSMGELSEIIYEFQKKYPKVVFNIYSGAETEVTYKIENGLLDMGLLFEFVNKDKYKFIRMKKVEKWGLLVRKDHKLAENKSIKPSDMKDLPIIITKNTLIQNELLNWMGKERTELDIKATYTLLNNAAIMVKNKIGVAVCLQLETEHKDLKFIPFYKSSPSQTILAWKSTQNNSTALKEFIQFIEEKRNQ